jgi:hypothetical protein
MGPHPGTDQSSENRHFRHKVVLVTFTVAVVIPALIIMWIVPSGIGGIKQILPYLFFSHCRGHYESPGGTSDVVVVTNDAGAMHSGNFPTWIMVEKWSGKCVVAKGYLRDSRGPVPLEWVTETTFTVTFCAGRYDNDNVSVDVRLE